MSESLTVRAISIEVAIGGVAVAGAEALDLIQESPVCAERFRLVMALNAPGTGIEFYASLEDATITVALSLGTGGLGGQSSFEGQIDGVMLDVSAGIAILTGRDFAARLIDAEINASFSNQTASAIAAQFAQEAGLSATITPTTQRIGQYYELAHNGSALGLHSRHPTRWDLLVDLAQIEGFVVGVQGTALMFGPPAVTAPTILVYGQQLLALSADRALGLASPSVTVRSWNPRLHGAFSATSGPTGGLGITLVKPNLTQAQVLAHAQREQSRLAAQRVLVRAAMPGEFTLAPLSVVQIEGTNSSIDGAYQLRSIHRRISLIDGFTQQFEAILVT